MTEISGVLKNAVERGWQLGEIRQSLINAGYSLQEVDSEIGSFNQNSYNVLQTPEQQQTNSKSLETYQMPVIKKEMSKKTMVMLFTVLVLLVLVVVGASFFFFLR